MQNAETRSCQNCKVQFTIEPEDFDFYKKISVPPPTWCPECRAIRRMAWRNERGLHKQTCALTGKEVITCFAADSGVSVYDRDAWWSDRWDPFAYGQDYDFTKPFFKQFTELLRRVPMPAVFNSRCENTPYANHAGEQKNGYLVFASWGCENSAFLNKTLYAKNSFDMLACRYPEFSYEGVNSNKLYRCAFVENSSDCTDSRFLFDCRGCTNCFGCVGLRNKSYCFFNEQLSKEAYEERLQSIDQGSYQEHCNLHEKFNTLRKRLPRKYANILSSENATGDNLINTKNLRLCFDLESSQDVRFCTNGGMQFADSYDNYGAGANAELLYESLDVGDGGSRFFADIFVWGGFSVAYSYACHGSQNMFGCIGLHKRQYCILNKQYTKEEYERLVPQIIEHMNTMPYVDARGRVYTYGEFFPPELSPFAYNETIAQEYFPLTKDEALAQGYRWRDPETKQYTITKKPEDLPDHIKDVPDDILKETIGCAHQGTCLDQCTTAFRIIPEELSFYRRMNLPLPRLCPNCRHYERLKQRNPLRLWHRQCMCKLETHTHQGPCPTEFETSYAPEREEIVYCEQCYNNEVV